QVALRQHGRPRLVGAAVLRRQADGGLTEGHGGVDPTCSHHAEGTHALEVAVPRVSPGLFEEVFQRLLTQRHVVALDPDLLPVPADEIQIGRRAHDIGDRVVQGSAAHRLAVANRVPPDGGRLRRRSAPHGGVVPIRAGGQHREPTFRNGGRYQSRGGGREGGEGGRGGAV